MCKEGLTKTIIKRLLEDSTSKTAKEILRRWTEVYERTKVFSETARRTRRIATGDMKGSEFGVVLFSAFPALVNILEDYKFDHWQVIRHKPVFYLPFNSVQYLFRPHARCAIALACFLSKAYNLDNDKLARVQRVLRMTGLSLAFLHKMFYRMFTRSMCKM